MPLSQEIENYFPGYMDVLKVIFRLKDAGVLPTYVVAPRKYPPVNALFGFPVVYGDVERPIVGIAYEAEDVDLGKEREYKSS